MKDRININGVECEVRETYLIAERTRLLIPDKVNGSEFVEFAISSCAEKARDPEAERFHAVLSMIYYWGNCNTHLLQQRKFDLFSLSSPDFSPRLKEQCESVKIDPTGSPLLDNIQRMIRLGHPTEPKAWDEMLRRAIYRYPEWIPVVDDTEGPETWIDRALENGEKEALRMMGESNEPLESVWREISDQTMSLLTFMAERETFEILHQGMESVYRMIENQLDPDERFLFRAVGLKNPDYLNRIMLFDPSPVTRSFQNIIAKMYQQFSVKKASTILTPELLGDMFISYFNFYPVWLRFKLDEEAEKRYLRKPKLSYEALLDGQVIEKPDYTMDPFLEAVSKSNILNDYNTEPHEKSIDFALKGKKKQGPTFLFELQKKIVGLQATGISNKEIAKIVGHSPSYVSKIRKAAREMSRNSWEKGWHKPFLENFYRRTKKIYDGLPSDKKSLYKNFHTALIRDCIQRICKNSHLGAKQLEKELIPPCLRK